MNIPGYQILSELGQGGMATVYLAVQENLQRRVALKVMAPVLAVDQNYSARFLREARTIAGLSHPHIIAVHDVGVFENMHYLAMDYLEGGDLKDRISHFRLTATESLHIIKEIAGALDHAHREGYVHRDIKPENILFRKNDAAVLTDFGIAKSIHGQTNMTGTGVSIGTPHYMSPEQARGRDIDGRADLYSLGVVLFEMLTGQYPYDACDTLAIALAHLHDPVPVLPGAFKDFQPLIDRLLAKYPDERISTGAALVAAIDNFSNYGDFRFPSKSRYIAGEKETKTNRRFGLYWGLGGAVLSSTVFAGIFVVQNNLISASFLDDLLPDKLVINLGSSSASLSPVVLPNSVNRHVSEVSRPEEISGNNDGSLVQVEELGSDHKVVVEESVSPPPPPSSELNLTLAMHQAKNLAKAITVKPSVLDDDLLPSVQVFITDNNSPKETNIQKINMHETVATEIFERPQQSALVSEVLKLELNSQASMVLGKPVVEEITKSPPLDIEQFLIRVIKEKGAESVQKEDVSQPVLSPQEIQHQQVKMLLEQAISDVAQLRLTKPSGNNAFEKVQQVLLLDPWNEEALKLKNRIANKYLQFARSAIKKREKSKAEVYLQQSVLVLPEITTSVDYKLINKKIKHWILPPELIAEITGQMVLVPAGTFVMGDINDGLLEQSIPVHEVTVSSFKMGKFEVTFDQYDLFAKTVGRSLPDDEGWGRGNRPVVNISWEDASAFTRWLSEQTGQTYRLPSDAEWEYTARAGTTSQYFWGDNIEKDRANCNEDCSDEYPYTAPVGSFQSNSWGIHDMAGNVWEWTSDCWHGDYNGAPKDDSAWLGAGKCSRRVSRGGAWSDGAKWLRSAYRGGNDAGYGSIFQGFRIVQIISK